MWLYVFVKTSFIPITLSLCLAFVFWVADRSAVRRGRVLAFLWLHCGSLDCGCCWQRGRMFAILYSGLVRTPGPYSSWKHETSWNPGLFRRSHVWICAQTKTAVGEGCMARISESKLKCFLENFLGNVLQLVTLNWSWDQVCEGDGFVDDSSLCRKKHAKTFCRLVRIVWILLSTLFSNPFHRPYSRSPCPGRLRQSQQFSASPQYGPSSMLQLQAQQPCQKWPQNRWQADGEYQKRRWFLIQSIRQFSVLHVLSIYNLKV